MNRRLELRGFMWFAMLPPDVQGSSCWCKQDHLTINLTMCYLSIDFAIQLKAETNKILMGLSLVSSVLFFLVFVRCVPRVLYAHVLTGTRRMGKLWLHFFRSYERAISSSFFQIEEKNPSFTTLTRLLIGVLWTYSECLDSLKDWGKKKNPEKLNSDYKMILFYNKKKAGALRRYWRYRLKKKNHAFI